MACAPIQPMKRQDTPVSLSGHELFVSFASSLDSFSCPYLPL